MSDSKEKIMSDSSDIKKALTHEAFLQRESDTRHISFEGELRSYEYVKEGDIEHAIQAAKSFSPEGKGILSEDPLRNIQYHFVVSAAMITRLCVEGGLEHMEAYHLSDVYIQKVDKCKSEEEIKALLMQMMVEFATRMKALKEKPRFSKPITQSMDYIYDHLHQRILVEDIAEHVNLHPSYLAQLFKKETGTTIADYIRSKRITAAKNMLRYSEYSSVDISNYLAFQSHSHFISVFKQYVGMTPREYRMENFRTVIKEST